MRGTTSRQATMLSTLTTDSLIPVDHPIRRIKPVVEAELTELAPEFDAMYARTGRQSVPPEHLLKATVLMALYSIRSGHRHPHDGRSTGEQRVLQHQPRSQQLGIISPISSDAAAPPARFLSSRTRRVVVVHPLPQEQPSAIDGRCRSAAPHCRSDRADAGESQRRLPAIQTVLFESVKVEPAEPGNRGQRQECPDGHQHPNGREAETVGKLLVAD